jgi:predicted MPP superfamily phosphohydrolase
MARNAFQKLQRQFWRSFFRLVIFTGALAEWVFLAWVLVVMLGVAVPWYAHVAGPLVLHLFNRRVLGGRPRGAPPRDGFARYYIGFVFTSLFVLLALAANAVVWGLVGAGLAIASLFGAPVAATAVLGPMAITGSLALVVVAGVIGWGYGPGQARVHILELEAPIAGLPDAFDGFRIAQLSDIHLGGYMHVELLAHFVDKTNGLGADLICVTGDITDGLDHAPDTFPVLGGLSAPEGVVAILGNHDHYTGADAVAAALREHTGFRVMRDESFALERDGGRLHILGVDDAGDDWTRGLREHYAVPPLVEGIPSGEPSVLLSHRPDLFGQAAALGIGLVLSGHTHGGQIALPWPSRRPSSLAHFISDFPRGTYRLGDSTLHVNLGIGVTGQPVRVFSPREITLITLRPKNRGRI